MDMNRKFMQDLYFPYSTYGRFEFDTGFYRSASVIFILMRDPVDI